MLGASLGSVDGLEIVTNECTEIGFWEGKMLVTTLVAMDRIPLGA